jgi:hypothetical protein
VIRRLRLERAFEPGAGRLLGLDFCVLRRLLFEQTPEARLRGIAARRVLFWSRLSALQPRDNTESLLPLVSGRGQRFVVAEQRQG